MKKLFGFSSFFSGQQQQPTNKQTNKQKKQLLLARLFVGWKNKNIKKKKPEKKHKVVVQ